MGRSVKIVLGAVVAVVVLVVGGLALYYFVLKDDPPGRVALSTDDATDATEPAGEAPATADGTWVVQPGEDTLLGYRVTEQFASVPAPSDAVGRTSAVEGELVITGSTVESATVTGDLSQLESDADRRDNYLRGDALQTDEFPEATFTLTNPVDLGEAPTQGTEVDVIASGDLTLHGVTQSVEIPIQAVWNGATIEVVGTLPITFADYDIETPNIAGFVSVEDDGEMEVQLLMAPG